jgi:hypothetical protein
MSSSSAEAFRNLVDTINHLAMSEATDTTASPEQTTPDVDSLLTKPAGLEKIAGSLDSGSLIKMLDIPQNQVSDFNQALNALRDDEPKLTNKQAMALATAFDHLLRSSGQGKANVLNKLKTVGAPVKESDETKPKVGIDDVVKIIKDCSEMSPVSKLQATKLVQQLTQGMADKKRSGGVSHILTGISDTLHAATEGDEAGALKNIAVMVNKVEGDEMAIDQTHFPQIVTTLMLLVGDCLQHSDK